MEVFRRVINVIYIVYLEESKMVEFGKICFGMIFIIVKFEIMELEIME